jgi:ribosomal protein L29
MAKKVKLSEKNPAELNELLSAKRDELRTLRFSGVGSRVKDSNDPKNVRKDIARILTELHARTRAAAGAPKLTKRAKTASA